MIEEDQKPSEIIQPTPRPAVVSPPWSRSTKIIVVIGALLLIVLLTYRFQGLIGMITLAAILSYILKPLIDFVNRRTHISRGLVIVLVYLLIAVGIVWLVIVLGVAAFDQAFSLVDLIPNIIEQTTARFDALTTATEPITFGPFEIVPVALPWESIGNQLLGLVEPAVGTSGQVISRVATGTVRILTNLLFIFVISIYLAVEIPRFGGYIGRVANQPGYQRDAERLMKEFGRIWNAYLRGQVLLGLVIFLFVWLGLAALGVRNALVLGVVSGLLEFVPNLGPVIGTLVAMIVAFFQPSNPFGLVSWQYALVVLALMIVIQQLENHLLVPRIVGRALDLHPLIVILGVFMGASLAGILGAVLAAPVLATLKLLGVYAWRKMFDLPPFPEADVVEPSPPKSLITRLREAFIRGDARTDASSSEGKNT